VETTTSLFLAPTAKDRPASETRQGRSVTGRGVIAHPLGLVLVVAALFTIFAGTAQADPSRHHHDYYRLIQGAGAGNGSAGAAMTGAIHGALAGGATTYGTRTGSGSAGGAMTGAIHGALAGGATTYGTGRATVQGAACAHGFATTEAPKQCGFAPTSPPTSAARPVARTAFDWSSARVGVAAGALLVLLALCAGALLRQRRKQPRPA